MPGNRFSAFFGACALSAFASPVALASEQGDLMACYRDLEVETDGHGRDLGKYEQFDAATPPAGVRSLVMLPGKRGGVNGHYFYGGDRIFFVPQRQDGYFVLEVPEWGPMYCFFFLEEIECEGQKSKSEKYEKIRPTEVPGNTTNRALLRTDIMMRMQNLTLKMRKDLQTYVDDRAQWDYETDHPTGFQKVYGFLWGRRPGTKPMPPDRDNYTRLLRKCRQIEDEPLHSMVNTTWSLLQNTSLPPPSPNPKDCPK
jgi:hypothetical protein